MTDKYLIMGIIIGFLWGAITGVLNFSLFGWQWWLLIIAGNTSYFLGYKVNKR